MKAGVRGGEPVDPGYTGIDNMVLLGVITLGYLFAWLGLGALLALYVRANTKDERSKTDNCWLTFWLVGLASFFMWLLWFSVYAAHLNPQVHPMAASNCPID